VANNPVGTSELPVISGVFDGVSWRKPSGVDRAILIDPSTEEPLCEVNLATDADLEAIVAPATAAFTSWSRTPIAERIDLLHRIAVLWEERGEEIAQSVSREMGMPIALSRLSNAQGAARTFAYFAELLEGQAGISPQIRDSRSFDGRTHVFSNPVGVVAAIAPWNFPGVLITSKLAPALASGCTVVLKPAVENALTAHVIASVLKEAGVPPGVVTIAIGGPRFGQELVKDPRIALVAFTGSTAVGRAIGSVVGERLGRTNLELGGKSAAIVLDDADMDVVSLNLPPLAFRNSGQTCFAQSRVIATPLVYDDVVLAMREWAQAQVLGPALDDATTFGPLGTRQHRERVLGFRDRALKQGATWVNEGDERLVPERGFFVPPVVLADVDNSWEVAQEEIFGPVVTIIRARDEEHAFELANDSRYGLAGSVWTANEQRALELARRVEAGSVGINGFRPDLGAPFGGIKESGQGRENGPEALDCYLRADTVYAFR
jgi:aldehyde dehydrogenase (NAD+)